MTLWLTLEWPSNVCVCLSPAGLPASTVNEHLGMLLDAAKTAKSPAYLARNVMELYDK